MATIRHSSKSSSYRTVFLRFGFWILIVAAFLLGIGYLLHSSATLFLSKNPWFTVKKIQISIKTGPMRKEDISRHLSQYPQRIVIEESNLFDTNLAGMRNKLMKDPLIKDVELQKRLPDTLSIIVYSRSPVARLGTPKGRMIDEEGVVLPDDMIIKKTFLPIIQGIQHWQSYKVGSKINAYMIRQALACIKHLRSMKYPYLNGKSIQIDHNTRQFLILCLMENTDYHILDDCKLVLPVGQAKIQTALQRAADIIALRAKAKHSQSTAFINLTHNRPNVRSYP